jgi:hypothetical protein
MVAKKKLAGLVTVSLLALMVIVVPNALAQGWFAKSTATPTEIAQQQTDMFQRDADILGLKVDEIKDGWVQGLSLEQIAQNHGISQADLQTKMKELRKTEMTNELKVLVDQGVITQAQADQRLQVMQTRIDSGQGMGRRGGRGMGMGDMMR